MPPVTLSLKDVSSSSVGIKPSALAGKLPSVGFKPASLNAVYSPGATTIETSARVFCASSVKKLREVIMAASMAARLIVLNGRASE